DCSPEYLNSCSFVVKVLREAWNKGALRSFCNADRFPTSKSFAGRALFDDVSLQVNRGDLIKFQYRSIDSSKLCVYIFAIWVRQLLFVRQKNWRNGSNGPHSKWACPKASSSARTSNRRAPAIVSRENSCGSRA